MIRPKRQLELRGLGAFLYLMQAQDGDSAWVKIGISKEPEARVSIVQSGCPLPIIELWCMEIVSADYAKLAEAKCHLHLEASRGCGEWFRGVADENFRCDLVKGPIVGPLDGIWQHVDLRSRNDNRHARDRSQRKCIDRMTAALDRARRESAAMEKGHDSIMNGTKLEKLFSCYKS